MGYRHSINSRCHWTNLTSRQICKTLSVKKSPTAEQGPEMFTLDLDPLTWIQLARASDSSGLSKFRQGFLLSYSGDTIHLECHFVLFPCYWWWTRHPPDELSTERLETQVMLPFVGFVVLRFCLAMSNQFMSCGVKSCSCKRQGIKQINLNYSRKPLTSRSWKN